MINIHFDSIEAICYLYVINMKYLKAYINDVTNGSMHSLYITGIKGKNPFREQIGELNDETGKTQAS